LLLLLSYQRTFRFSQNSAIAKREGKGNQIFISTSFLKNYFREAFCSKRRAKLESFFDSQKKCSKVFSNPSFRVFVPF